MRLSAPLPRSRGRGRPPQAGGRGPGVACGLGAVLESVAVRARRFVCSGRLVFLALVTAAVGCGTGGGGGAQSAPLKGYPARSAQTEARGEAAPASVAATQPAREVPPPSPNVLAPGGGVIGAPEPGGAGAPGPAPVMRSRADSPMPVDTDRASSVEWTQSEPPPRRAEGRLRFVVRGVAPDDVLNVRTGPGSRYEVIGTIPPDATGVTGAAGGRRQVGQAIWREVTYAGVRGWVNDRFLVEDRASGRDLDRSR